MKTELPPNKTPTATGLPPLPVPESYNYLAAFLTLDCNYQCSYCITDFSQPHRDYPPMPGARWIEGLNRLVSRPDLPITLQGGEPSLHPDFYAILGGLRQDLNIDLLTNLQFGVDEFMDRVPPERLRRPAPYASIRVSYHPEAMDLKELRDKVLRLLARGYSVGIWAVRHPAWFGEIERAREECAREGIDFRFKEFLGRHDGALHGTYAYPGALSGRAGRRVKCRTTELIIGPDGHVFRCHADLYLGRASIGHLCDPAFRIADIHRSCDAFGTCNPCDVKVKTNRFQEFGHTSVDIRPAGKL